MDLKARTIQGVSWSAISKVIQFCVGFFTTLILARIISPEDFGLFGMVAVFMGFFAIIQEFGMGASIVQNQEINNVQLSSIFWLNLLFSSILFILLIIISPLISRFYAEPNLTSITRLFGIIFIGNAFSLVPVSIITKNLEFKKLSIIQSVTLMLGSGLGISSAYLGLGVWSLVIQQITISFSRAFLAWISVSWIPDRAFTFAKIKKQTKFSIYLQAGSVLNYITRNADDLLVGKFIGANALGYYQMAYRIMQFPLDYVSQVVGQVMFPALSIIQNDIAKVRSVYLKSLRAIALVTFPFVMGLFVIAPSVIYILLGEEWMKLLPILQILCILGIPQSLATTTGWIFLSQGRTDIRFRMQVVFTTLFLISFIIGLNWGAIGVAICYTIMSILLTPIQFHIAGKLIDVTFCEIIKSVASIFFCGLLMAIVIFVVGEIMPSNWPEWLILIVQIIVGGITYFSLVHILKINAYLDIREIVWNYLFLRFRSNTIK